MSCTFLFIITLVVIYTYLLTASRKSNICIAASLLCGIAFAVFVYYVILENISDESYLDFAKIFSSYPKFTDNEAYQVGFIKSQVMSLSFFIIFTIANFIIKSLIIPNADYINNKLRYRFMKYLLVFINMVIVAMVISFIVGSLNGLYGMNNGWLNNYFAFVSRRVLSI